MLGAVFTDYMYFEDNSMLESKEGHGEWNWPHFNISMPSLPSFPSIGNLSF
jgi:hypothetical protein